MARNQMAKKVVDAEKGTVTFTFSNGKTLVADVDKLDPVLVRRLALHGLGQKVGDSYAGSETVDEAVENAGDVYEMLANGKWTERVAGEPRTSLLAEALQRVMAEGGTTKTLEDCIAAVKKLDDEGRKNLRGQPAVKAAMSAIKAERDAAAVNKDDAKPFDPAAVFG